MTRAEAKLAGEPRFMSDKPCGRGHIGEHYTECGSCVPCKRMRMRSYRAEKTRRRLKAKEFSDIDGECQDFGSPLTVTGYIELPPVPDFLARAEARIQAARAGS